MPDIGFLKSLMGKVAQGQALAQAVQGLPGALMGSTPNFGGMAGMAQSPMHKAGPIPGAPPFHNKLPAGGQSAVQMQKALFMSILTHALEKAHDSAHFNLDSAVHEVTQRLGHIRTSKGEMDKLHHAMSNNAALQQQLGQVLNQVGALSKQAAKHLHG